MKSKIFNKNYNYPVNRFLIGLPPRRCMEPEETVSAVAQ
jgi:hypothetical protein